MESGPDTKPSSTTLKLSLFSLPSQSPEPSGMLTPPIRAAASVPFVWEEAPGKPRAITTTTIANRSISARCLELPPRLLTEVKFANTSSPTTVLDGPYMGRSASRSRSRSFSSPDPERSRAFDTIFLHSKRESYRERVKWGSWGRRALKGHRQVGEEGNFFISSPSPSLSSCLLGENGGENPPTKTKVKIARFRRSGSFLGLPSRKSHFWGRIRESLEQMVPWLSRK